MADPQYGAYNLPPSQTGQQWATGGGQYGFGINDLLSMLMLPLTGNTKTDNAAYDVQAQGTNNMQDLFQMFLSPEFGLLSGTYDPMLAAPAAPQPVTPFSEQWGVIDQYVGSANPDIAYVANGMKSGQLDGLTARQYLNNAMSTSLTGITPEQIESMVASMEKEVADNSNRYMQYQADVARAEAEAAAAPRNDVFAKYGLPSPLEQYTPETLPMDSSYYQQQAQNDQDLQNAYTRQQQADAAANSLSAGRLEDNDRALTTAANRDRNANAAHATQQEFIQRNADWLAQQRENDKVVERMKRQGVPQSTIDAFINQRDDTGPTLTGGNSLADKLATRMFMHAKDQGKVDTSAPKPAKPATVAKPKKTQDQINAGAAMANAKNKAISLQGEAGGAAFLANKQGRSPLMDALMNRFMAGRNVSL